MTDDVSVYCRVAHPHLLVRALAVLTITKDAWATFSFTDTALVLHVEGAGHGVVATATLPIAIFSEYVASGTRFAVHLVSLCDALLLGGSAPLASASLARVVLAYPIGDARLLVELTEGDRVLQSTLLTKPAKDSLPALFLTDAPVVNQVALLGGVAREVIEDLVVAQSPRVAIVLNPHKGLLLRGEGGPYGAVEMEVQRKSGVILSSSNEDINIHTKVLRSHLALACGVRQGSRQWRGAGATPDVLPGTTGISGSGIPQLAFGGFERLLFQVNKNHQLSVLHMPRDHDIAVAVNVVVPPLSLVCDE